MSAFDPRVAATRNREKIVVTISAGIASGYAASLFLMYRSGSWLFDAAGQPQVQDFVAFWTAGREALKGAALSIYDPHLQHAAEVATIGHDFSGVLGWTYPPLFLFVASVLALFPYAAAFAIWCTSTLALHAYVIAKIAKRWSAFAVACAAPWTLTALTPGQNGFLTAALIGLALLHLERRPALAGLFLGLAGYKPQFGILFPFALAAGGYWRAFAWAAATAIAWNALAGAVFGMQTIDAFLHSLAFAGTSHLANGGVGWNKLQSIFGLVGAAGFSGTVALIFQLAASLAIVAGVSFAWRTRLPFSLKAAFIAAGAPLATPYVFTYDLPVLAVAVAFLFRQRDFDEVELALLASILPATFAYLWLPIPTALFASLAIGAIVLRRCYAEVSRSRRSPSWATEAISLPSSE